jgi:hypothetical protein
LEIKDKFNMDEFLNTTGTAYFKEENMKVARYSGFDDWVITDLTHALKGGKSCREYTIKSEKGVHGNLVVTNFIHKFFGSDLKKLWTFCSALPFQESYDPVRTDGLEIYRREIKSIRVFSPFNLSTIKPLKKMPEKWTLSHVRAVIVNNQFEELKCTGVYTDDYAFDDAVNYRKGEIKAPLSFIKDIIERPSGWWTSFNGGSVKVCCHTFNNNEFTPAITTQ